MPQQRFQRRVTDLLAEADVRIDGERPWDLQVHDAHFYARVLGQGGKDGRLPEWWDKVQRARDTNGTTLDLSEGDII